VNLNIGVGNFETFVSHVSVLRLLYFRECKPARSRHSELTNGRPHGPVVCVLLSSWRSLSWSNLFFLLTLFGHTRSDGALICAHSHCEAKELRPVNLVKVIDPVEDSKISFEVFEVIDDPPNVQSPSEQVAALPSNDLLKLISVGL
jgi:hypothetical protein